jgi:hypothetical protein
MHAIQPEPICIYWRTSGIMAPSWSIIFFHEDFKEFTFNEFCLYIIIAKIESLQSEGFDVKWGYVNSHRIDKNESLQDYKQFLEREVEHENNSSNR